MASQTGLSRLFTGFFRFHYWLGARTIRKWRHFSRWFGRVSAPARRTLRYYWTRRIKWPVHRFARKQRILRRQTLVALKFLWRQTKEKPSSAIPTLFRLCGGAVRHYWDELTSLGRLPQTLRMIKDAGEIESIKKAAAISCKAFENLLGKIHPGMTEKQVQILLDYEMLNLGSEHPAFDTIAAAGVNGSLPHAIPSDHVIRAGELLTLDFGATVDGYCADMTRTIGFGKISAELRELYQRVLDAHNMALDAVRPGAVCGDVDKAARDFIDARYPGTFGHSTGHGVGLFIHEQPRVAQNSTTILEVGHVVTIEPGIYIPGLGGCRIEDMAILTSDGYIDPITAPKQLIEL